MNNISNLLDSFKEVYIALSELELKGVAQCGVYYKGMSELANIYNSLVDYNMEILERQKKEQMEEQKKKRAFVKEEVELEE